ncbi:ferredoxin--NADP reductase [Gordonia sp. CPCC 206044]|uniref:2Fe-2S iron-sulfur cluster-binding protein n=1 Tax=Gordonia sp. CPCC 206044 TaxID=3140793 RepID=UPI003AF35728
MTTIEFSAAQTRSAFITVRRVIAETSDAKSIEFDVPADRADDFDARPGQFVTLRVPDEHGEPLARCYSLSGTPMTGDPLTVTVKRVRGGRASNWLCDNAVEGMTLEALPPAGTFTPTSTDDDLLLWGAGSGITPLISILRATLAGGRGRVTLVYANRDADSVIFGDHLRDLMLRYPDRLVVAHWLESMQHLPSAEGLATFAAAHPTRHSYICGPAGFSSTVRAALDLAGVAPHRIHTEVYASLTGDPFAPAPAADDPDEDTVTVEVETAGERHTIHWPRRLSLVDAMTAQGVDVPYSCREGQCGTCACTVVDGDVTMIDTGVLDEDDVAAGYVLACQARPLGDFVRIRF